MLDNEKVIASKFIRKFTYSLKNADEVSAHLTALANLIFGDNSEKSESI